MSMAAYSSYHHDHLGFHDHLGYHDHFGQRQESTAISPEAKAAHREVVQYRDLLLLQKVSLHKSVNHRN